METCLFEGEDYKVVHVVPERKTTNTVLFTMNSWSKEPGLHHPPFAISMARELGMAFLGVIPRTNCWWQHPEFGAVRDVIAAKLAGREVMAYGSSMGAYGIINAAAEVEITRGLAFVPQYSIDRAVVPFEKRWSDEAAQLTFENDRIQSAEITAPFTVIYDEDHGLDRQHIALLKPRMPQSRFISLPGSGHNPAAHLLAQGRLKQVVTDWMVSGVWPDSAPSRVPAD